MGKTISYTKEELPERIILPIRAKDITNQKFGRLTALYPCGKNKYDGSINWVCQCECSEHKYILATLTNLKRGVNKSCGSTEDFIFMQEENKKNKQNELIGKTFNQLYVESYSHTENKRIFYNCICKLCGSKVIIRKDSLQNGHAQSCGCMRSHGENAIKQFLNKHNIQFISEYKFNDLKDKSYLRFDFAILKDNQLQCLIEYDGKQHYEKDESTFFSSSFEDIQKRDMIKNEYCRLHLIPLYRIRYDEDVNTKMEEILNVL